VALRRIGQVVSFGIGRMGNFDISEMAVDKADLPNYTVSRSACIEMALEEGE
jgi:hypothetical protein